MYMYLSNTPLYFHQQYIRFGHYLSHFKTCLGFFFFHEDILFSKSRSNTIYAIGLQHRPTIDLSKKRKPHPKPLIFWFFIFSFFFFPPTSLHCRIVRSSFFWYANNNKKTQIPGENISCIWNTFMYIRNMRSQNDLKNENDVSTKTVAKKTYPNKP